MIPKERQLMNISEELMAETLDEIIKRSMLRLEQERVQMSISREGGDKQISARTNLGRGTAALNRVKVYRSKFGQHSGLNEKRGKKYGPPRQ
jgi:hypothetical protein